jgi:hypothetical protein
MPHLSAFILGMRFLAILLALLALPAQAAEPFVFQRSNGITYQVPMPDDHWFANEPISPIVFRSLPAAETAEYCTRITGQFEDGGCAYLTWDQCLITVSADQPSDLYAATLRHEEAHCRGWPADHPQD